MISIDWTIYKKNVKKELEEKYDEEEIQKQIENNIRNAPIEYEGKENKKRFQLLGKYHVNYRIISSITIDNLFTVNELNLFITKTIKTG